MKLRNWRTGIAAAAFVSVSVAVALAYTSNLGIWANSQGHVTANAYVSTSWLTEGPPYVQVKIDGLTDWNGGSASLVCWPSWCASANANTGVQAAGGTFTARAEYFVNDQLVQEKTDTRTFEGSSDPPAEGGGDGDPLIDCNCPSPILLPVGKSAAIRLTSAADGVVFDIRADGIPVQVAWTRADSEMAFLALDRNGNGVIDSGAELFGDHTLPGVPNGFLALGATAGHNGDGSIDADDPLYGALVLWTDRNHNGFSEYDELQPLSDVYEAVGLGYLYAPRRDGFGNRLRYQGWARKIQSAGQSQREFAREIKIYDVFLRVQ